VPRLVAATIAFGAAAIAALGAIVAAVWNESWGDGIGAVCVTGAVLWLAAAVLLFCRWLLVGSSSPALRVGAAAACVALISAGMWFEVDFAAYDGCATYFGRQPILTVPISLVTERPVMERDTGLFDLLPCELLRGRAYEVGPFGAVP
jgi:hypothetical protein